MPLLPPWLTIFTISFCRQPPFGPRLFRYALVLAMCWYAFAGLLGETLHYFFHTSASGQFSFTLARLLMYPAALTFIVFVPCCVDLHNLETGHPV